MNKIAIEKEKQEEMRTKIEHNHGREGNQFDFLLCHRFRKKDIFCCLLYDKSILGVSRLIISVSCFVFT